MKRRYSSHFVLWAISTLGLIMLLACSGTDTKYQQYYVQGQQLYIKHCSNCHQKDGTGLGRLYPPIKDADYLSNNLEAVVCLIRYGKSGEITVNGISFNKQMPAIPTLTDLEIAEIATYIYNTWHPHRGLIDVKDVSPALKNCK